MGRSRGSIFWGSVLLVAGIIFLLDQLLDINLWLYVWPILLILLGLWFLLGRTLLYGHAGKNTQQVLSFSSPAGNAVAADTTPAASTPGENRPTPAFNRVQQRGFGNLTLTQGDREELVIDAPEFIRARIRTDVQSGTLAISYHANWWEWLDFGFWGRNRVEFHLTMRDIAGLDISGAGNITSESIKSPRLDIAHSGAGNITLSGLEIEQVIAHLHGAGNTTLKGTATSQEITMSGAGNYNGDDLESHTARMTLSGVGNASLWVRDTLDITMSGVGNVEYYGNPTVNRHTSGVGHIHSKGDR